MQIDCCSLLGVSKCLGGWEGGRKRGPGTKRVAGETGKVKTGRKIYT